VWTRILLVTLPEATPVHEAAALARDLERAGIHPFAWVIQQSLLPLVVTDPLLVRRRAAEQRYHDEVAALAPRVAVIPYDPQDGTLSARFGFENPVDEVSRSRPNSNPMHPEPPRSAP
jgi:arsenite-transporting ATPase